MVLPRTPPDPCTGRGSQADRSRSPKDPKQRCTMQPRLVVSRGVEPRLMG